MPEIAPQRRARRIAMSADERDAFLREQRTCRVASAGGDGAPHVTPTWFVWDGEHIWISSIVRAQRHANLLRDPRVAIVVDAGDGYFELRGVELSGTAEVCGESPRTGETDPLLERVEAHFAEKYNPGAPFVHDGKHAWLRITPQREYTWDFRKL
jgi:PPOX class probable F420-dependent enzyme